MLLRAVVGSACAAGLCVGLIAPIAQGTPAPAGKIDKQVDAASDDLADASKVVSRAREMLDAAQSQLPAARQRLAAAAVRLAQTEQAEAVAAQALIEADAAVAAAAAEADAIRAQIDQLRGQIALLAREAYTGGENRFRELEILLNSQDPGEFADRLAALKSISRGNNDALARMIEAQEALARKLAEVQALQAAAEQRRQEAANRVAAAGEARTEAAAAKAEVARLVSQRSAALRLANSQRSKVKARYDALRAEQERIAREAAAAAAAHQGGGSAASGSGLAWPIPGGEMSGGVGLRVHPVYGYRSCHTGIDIGAGSGAPIHAADDGTVVSTESGGPYGNHTLIAHGNGLSTMYAHQSRFGVSPGEHVARGEVIGYVGQTGYATGPHLHFEVHVNGSPYDPMGWFGGSRAPVDCW